MNSRKSLGHVLLDEASATASSPLRRRSVLAQMQQPSGAIDIVNDDNTERAGNRRSLSLTGVAKMSLPQIKEGIAECIKLNTQNKINIKNAFSLSMIDFMEFMVKSRDEGISNLQVASTTLDVSAKIYGLRVDSLHHDTLKMMGQLDGQSKDAATNNDDNEASLNTTASQDRPKRKRKGSQKILTSIESLQGKPEKVSLDPPMFGDADCQTTDMLYQSMLPKHCGGSLNLHPYKDVICDIPDIPEIEDDDDDDSEISNIDSWQKIDINGTEEMSGMFENFEFLNWNPDDIESITSSQETQMSDANDSLAFDMNASFTADDNGNHNAPNFFDIHDDDQEESQVAQFRVMNRIPEQIEDVEEIINNIVSKRLEYTYFNENLNIRQAGPAQWTVKNAINRLANSRIIGKCRQDKRKKDFRMDFDDDAIEHLEGKFRVPRANIHRINKKTAQNGWLEEKILLGIRNGYDIDRALRYKLRPDDYFPFNNKQNEEERIEENRRISLGDIANNSNGDFDDDNVHHDDHDDQHMDEDIPANDGEVFTQDGFVGDNLVEAPKLTEKIYIPFSQRAKKLDMRNLKRSIWKSLDTSDGEKENIVGEEHVLDAVKDIKQFSNVYEHLPEKLNKNDSNELTFQIAFVSLLHLANEKNLRILSKDDGADLTIFQDTQ